MRECRNEWELQPSLVVFVRKEKTKSIVIVHLWQKNVLESSKAQYTLYKEKSTNEWHFS